MSEIHGYIVTELRRGLFAIDEGGVRSFLAAGGEAPLLIDSGYGKGDIRKTAEQLAGGEVRLLLTHADSDHTGGAKQFSRALLHPAEEARLRAKCPAFAGEIERIHEGDTVRAGAYAFKVIHLPGHTPGSIALLEENARFLIAGDTVSAAPVFLFGEGRDIPQYIQSLERLISMRDKFDEIDSAHGELPTPPALLDDLCEGAKRLLAGELPPADPPMPLPCKVYAYKRARFLAAGPV